MPFRASAFLPGSYTPSFDFSISTLNKSHIYLSCLPKDVLTIFAIIGSVQTSHGSEFWSFMEISTQFLRRIIGCSNRKANPCTKSSCLCVVATSFFVWPQIQEERQISWNKKIESECFTWTWGRLFNPSQWNLASLLQIVNILSVPVLSLILFHAKFLSSFYSWIAV